MTDSARRTSTGPREPKADPRYPQFPVRKMIEAGDRAISEHESVMAEGGICRGNAMHARQVAMRVLEVLGIEPGEAS